MVRRLVLFLAAAAVGGPALAGLPGAAAGGGCHPSDALRLTDEQTDTVLASGCAFLPTVVRVNVGDDVAFANNDIAPHTFTGVASSFGDFKEYGLGESVTYSFQQPGVYPYFCALHPTMAGAVVVGDASASAAGAVRAADLVSLDAPGASADEQAAAEEGDGGGLSWGTVTVIAGAVLAAGAMGAAAFLRARTRARSQREL